MQQDVVVVPHTHWDREWYRTFQAYRLRMVEAIERILKLLEEGVLPHFLLDGQTVMLDDYLEIRPGDADRIRRAVEAGELGIGPWYILPDEFLVSGEAIVRNLLFGRERMERFGATRAVGYLPDMFGHTAQMPQILRGFGLDRAIVWRGVDPPSEHFWWEDLGGGGMATVFLPTGYCNVHLWRSDLEPEERQRLHDEFVATHRLGGPHLLLSGCDHLAPDPHLPAISAAVGARLGRLDDALVGPGKGGLPIVRGELRQQGRAYLLPDVASARMPLKQQNAELQDMWERSVEPLLALRCLAGSPVDLGFWREGWELILKNQPHDSICGCSIDEVHREMQARSSQARSLGLELIARCFDAFAPDAAEPGLIAFNPSTAARSGWVEVVAEVATCPESASSGSSRGATWSAAHLEGVPSIFLEASSGREFYADIAYHPDWKSVTRYRFLAYLSDVGPFELVHHRLVEGPGSPEGAPLGVVSGEHFIENEWLRLEVCEGRIQLTHKPTGAVVENLLRFVDGGDAGDEYTYSPPSNDRQKVAQLKGYEVEDASGAMATLAVEHSVNLPAALTPDRESRALLQVSTAIHTRLTLVAGERAVRFDTRLDNWAHDHRLRALIGTGTTHPRHLASEVAFGAVDRLVSKGLGELPVSRLAEAVPPTFPHQGWVAVEGEQLAMQVLAPGLPEAEIVHGGSALAVTLLRCVGWLSRDDLRTRGGGAGPELPTPEAQLEGSHRFIFAARFDQPAALGRQAWWDALGELDALRHPLRMQSTGGHRRPLARGLANPAPWPGEQGGGSIISAMKPASWGEGVVIRAFNPTGEPSAFSVVAPAGWRCQPCDLAERPGGTPSERFEERLESGQIASCLLSRSSEHRS